MLNSLFCYLLNDVTHHKKRLGFDEVQWRILFSQVTFFLCTGSIPAVKDIYNVTCGVIHAPSGGFHRPGVSLFGPRHPAGHDWLGAALQARAKGMSLRECCSLALRM